MVLLFCSLKISLLAKKFIENVMDVKFFNPIFVKTTQRWVISLRYGSVTNTINHRAHLRGVRYLSVFPSRDYISVVLSKNDPCL